VSGYHWLGPGVGGSLCPIRAQVSVGNRYRATAETCRRAPTTGSDLPSSNVGRPAEMRSVARPDPFGTAQRDGLDRAVACLPGRSQLPPDDLLQLQHTPPGKRAQERPQRGRRPDPRRTGPASRRAAAGPGHRCCPRRHPSRPPRTRSSSPRTPRTARRPAGARQPAL
jgi:hypothetical protein